MTGRLNLSIRTEREWENEGEEKEERGPRELGRSEPRKHMAEMAGLHRNGSWGMGCKVHELEKFKVRSRVRRAERRHRY